MKSVSKAKCQAMGHVYRKSVRSPSGTKIRSASCARKPGNKSPKSPGKSPRGCANKRKSHTRKLKSGVTIRVKSACVKKSRRSASKPKSRSRSASKPKSRSRSVAKSRSRSRSASKPKSRSRSASKPKSRSRSASKPKSRSRSASKSRSRSRSASKPKSRSRSASKSRSRSRSASGRKRAVKKGSCKSPKVFRKGHFKKLRDGTRTRVVAACVNKKSKKSPKRSVKSRSRSKSRSGYQKKN